jgi:hypothetical protein
MADYWPSKIAETVKEAAGAFVAFIRHPFGPDDPADDPDYLELRDRVLRSYGVWAPPGPSYQIGGFSELERPSNPPARGGKYE